MGLKEWIVPQERRFFTLLEEDAKAVAEGAHALLDLLRDFRDVPAKQRHIKDIEHRGDQVVHTIFEELNRSFITPFDREDIYSLTKRMDDVLDLMDDVADILVLYQIDRLDDGMIMLLDVTKRAVADIHKSVHSLRKMNYDIIREQVISVHALENEGDRLYRHFIGNLYAEEKDAIRLMKYSSIYNELEQTIDKCEDLMNAIESIVLKQA